MTVEHGRVGATGGERTTGQVAGAPRKVVAVQVIHQSVAIVILSIRFLIRVAVKIRVDP